MTRRSAKPVLVLGSGLTALAAIRLLHHAGFDPYVVGKDAGLARHSRWFRAAPASPGAVDARENLSEYLDGLPFEQAALLPCSDDWILRVARSSPAVSQRFPASVSSADVVGRLLDKWLLAEVLQALELPHPRTISIDIETDLDSLSGSALSGMFIKPRDSSRFFDRFGVKAFHVRSRAEIATRLAEVATTGLAVQLQEYIPGPPESHFYVEGFIDRTGSMRALFLRRRLRMYPADFGNSTFFESIPLEAHPDAVQTVARLFTHLRFRGIFSVEFKQDARDGVCRLIEVNARPWWFIEFVGQCGVNLCEIAVRDALGEAIPTPGEYRVGRRCVYPYYDLSACRALRCEGRLSVASWFASWMTATQPVFRWSDPVPAVAESSIVIRDRLARFVGRRRHR